MKHLKSYKIFEDKDEDNEVPEGFEYSWNDIYESLLYLTDIGFEIDEKSQKRYLADEKGIQIKGEYSGYRNDNYTSNIEKAKNAIYEIRLYKKKETSRLRKEVQVGDSWRNQYRNYYLDSDIEGLLEIYEEIASFCARFDKSYHNLSIEHDGYSVWLVVSSDVTSDFINKKLDDEINDKVKSKLQKQVTDNFSRLSSDNKFYTKKFREEFFGSKLYEIKNGIFIQTFNWNSVTKGVYNTNSETFNKAIKYILNEFNGSSSWGLNKYGYKADFRELKEEDTIGLKLDWEIKSAKKYIGSKAIIVKFDYNSVFKKVKEELLKKEED
jgi:hypothetical protein